MNALWTEHQCGELMCYQVQPNKTKCEAEGRRNGLDGSLQDGRHARLALGWCGNEVIVTATRVDFFKLCRGKGLGVVPESAKSPKAVVQ